jgi:hypothetical protein
VSKLLQRLLARSGVLPLLRHQWREDQGSANAKLEKRLDKQVSSLKEQIDRLSAELTQRMQQVQPIAVSERVGDLDREVRILRATLALNLAQRNKGADDPGLLDPDRVGAHVQRAIAAARMETEPSSHIVINDLVPDDTYQALLDGIPPSAFFSQKDNIKQNLKLRKIDVAPDWTMKTLGFMEEVLIPRLIMPPLMRKFESDVRDFYAREYGAERAQQLAAIPHEATGGRLMLRRPGYHLDPHLDPSRVVITMLIYFARADDSEAFGTGFYRMNGVPKIDRTNTFYPGEQGITCDLVKMVPFKANTAVAFLNYGAAHGADIPKTAPRETERYAYQFYVSPEPAALAALVGETEAAVVE